MSNDAAIDEVKQAFKNADTNGDGMISLDELGSLMEKLCGFDEYQIFALFQAMDTNNDGQVSYDEFVDWVMLDDPTIVDEVMDAFLEAQEDATPQKEAAVEAHPTLQADEEDEEAAACNAEAVPAGRAENREDEADVRCWDGKAFGGNHKTVLGGYLYLVLGWQGFRREP
eukprot:TRINITY_DN31723_c0_g1_i3.p1 TRINITY_DN31723_c0_g1~~TRINITY_DN31723_c0_g1_i3.p1  ORF type:complete len:170 (-),score=40.17 TRINITY_DN31723_c0_g1_i3:323-832(-)